MKLQDVKVTLTLDDPNEFLESMEDSEKLEFLEVLSCHDIIIEHVMEQVFNEYTKNVFSGSEICSWDGNTPLQKFRKWMIEVGSDESTNKRIKYLERELTRKDKQIQSLYSEIREVKYNNGNY